MDIETYHFRTGAGRYQTRANSGEEDDVSLADLARFQRMCERDGYGCGGTITKLSDNIYRSLRGEARSFPASSIILLFA